MKVKKAATLQRYLIKMFVGPVTKDLQTVAVRS